MATSETPEPRRRGRVAAAPNPLECHECGLRVYRPSHLARHVESHKPLSQRSSLQCPSCPRHFSRKDVLLRHLRVTHKSNTPAKRSAQQSCHRCVSKKLKCNRGLPCQSCKKAEARCAYPDHGALQAAGGADSDLKWEKTVAQRGQESAELIETCSQSPMAGSARSVSNSSLVDPSLSAIYPSPISQQAVPSTMGNASSSPLPFEMLEATAVPSHRNANYSQLGPSRLPPMDTVETCFYPSTSQMLGTSELGIFNLDWLDLGTSNAMNFMHDYPSVEYNNQSIQPVPTVPTQWTQTNTLPTISAAAKHNFPLPSDGSEAQDRPGTATPMEQWPFDQSRTPLQHRRQRPSLREALRESLEHDGAPRSSKVLIQLLSGPYLPPSSDLQDPDTAAILNSIRGYVDAFFAEFNPILPIIHAPSWRMTSCPTILLAAMACLGAMFCADTPEAAIHSKVLSDICLHSIALLGHSDSAIYRDLDFLSACCLHQIYSLGSGNRELYQSADRSRGMLIGSLRCMNLLGCLPVAEGHRKDAQPSVSAKEPTAPEDWMAWKEKELEIRLTWSAFEYDCTLCTLTNRRGAVELAELPGKLPCSETLWDAPSAQAWNALRSHVPAGKLNASFRDALRNSMDGKVHRDLTAWGKRLCAQVIGRLLWDLRQLQIMSMPDYLCLTSLLSAQRQSRTELLGRLDRLTNSMASPSSTSDLINYNITGLICHYNHLCTTEEIMDLVVFLARTNVEPQSGSKTPEPAITRAKRRLESLLAVDLRRTRTLVWHAARIINIANQYIVSAPCEILRIFMGYAFLFAVARYCPQTSVSLGVGVSVRLDQAWQDDLQDEAMLEWIQFGGPMAVGDAANFCTLDGIRVIRLQAQKLLQKMRIWGLSGKFAMILGCLDERLDEALC